MASTNRLLPGFRLTLSATIVYTLFIVLIPLSAAFIKTFGMTWPAFWRAVASPRVVASYQLTFGASAAATVVSLIFGALIAWVLVRYPFPGRRIIDALIDLPFALPTAVAGIALTAIYAPNGWIGKYIVPWSDAVQKHYIDLQIHQAHQLYLKETSFNIVTAALNSPYGWLGQTFQPWNEVTQTYYRNLVPPLTGFSQYLAENGLKLAFTPVGITIALIFVGLPFVVRTVQPVLQELEPELEQAAATLGANRWQTITRVIFPAVWPALMAGAAMAFARAVGEYGSVVFISGNMPMKTEITPLLIVTKLEQYDYKGATAMAVVMLLISFSMLLVINYLQGRLNLRAKPAN